MRKICISTLLFLFISGFITHAYAFDGRRSGLVLGGGIGAGMTSYEWTIEALGESFTIIDRTSTLSFTTNFMLGGGVNDNMVLYYMSRVSGFMTEELDDELTAFGLNGLGIRYYFSPRAPSPLIKGALGLSIYLLPGEPELDPHLGVGFMFGAGYEFSAHWSIEADFVMGWPKDRLYVVTSTFSSYALQLTFNAIAY